MQPDTVVYKLVTEAPERSQWLVIAASLTSAAGALAAAYFTAYAKRRAESLATKHDFAEGLRQLSDTTRTVEKIKLEADARKALDSELRTALQAFTTSLATLLHSMCWLTWDAQARGCFNRALANGYDREAHEVMPVIAGQLALIASYDMTLHDQLAPLAADAFELDAAIGSAIVACERNESDGLPKLASKHSLAQAMETDLRLRISNIVGHRFAAVTRDP
jgi:hypothetical protein